MALGAMAQENDDPDVTQSLPEAVRLRSDYLRGQADHLTLPAVRRLLERDLGLRASQLDVHKALIKRLVDKVLNEGEDAKVVMDKPRKRRKNTARVVDDEGEPESAKAHVESIEKKRKISEGVNDLEEKAVPNDDEAAKKLDDSQAPKKEGEEGESPENKAKLEAVEEKQKDSSPSQPNVDENSIKQALMKRAAELKSRAESLTITHVRRLLEDDLGLEQNKLDVFKPFIRNLVDELLESTTAENMKAADEKDDLVQEGKPKKGVKGKSKRKAPSVDSSEHGDKGDAGSSGSESEEAKQPKVSKKKTSTAKKKTVEVKKAPESKKPFGPNVERLRAIFKTIDLGIPPSAYAKAKQAPEDERDDVLCKELETLLGKVGCPPNPSQQDIRKVKAQLRKKKDLDGIDNTNIVSEPRRNRASANSWFTPKPNRYLQDEKKSEKKIVKTPEDEEPDEEGKPKVTGRMDD
ncbi:hypothetical protein MPTK1_3g14690 [Marchantia polymorpha subsp. ruderalis]|uniref:Histone chaperone domain-containing protein n=2 Tax=Marchantia polymorpha TaxID=3197 RepID=A0AAF6B0U8_MARPO|nr:hypothetical protein MARPO_0004s0202 [Marchantia polymorpha]BBN05632.1 hypothetical protein Mp_3g14690 [Marchantia polymorpha subsp. ruderalis]|eukprot:PTQ48950.1 hypothetical protein MARPO_0004s0202 [Marchantia polymorpha]